VGGFVSREMRVEDLDGRTRFAAVSPNARTPRRAADEGIPLFLKDSPVCYVCNSTAVAVGQASNNRIRQASRSPSCEPIWS
jgi:hypothetical protein